MRKQWLVGAFTGALALAGLAFVQGGQEGTEPTAAVPGEYPSGQPIAFPHDLHAGIQPGQAQIDCQYCHYSAERSVDAGIPAVSVCWGCHQVIPGRNNPEEVQKLAQYWADQEQIPWVRIYKISDHAHYPHMRHVAAGIACQTCHGQVQEMSVLNSRDPAWGGNNMGWCIECHRTEGASTDCAVCHY